MEDDENEIEKDNNEEGEKADIEDDNVGNEDKLKDNV